MLTERGFFVKPPNDANIPIRITLLYLGGSSPRYAGADRSEDSVRSCAASVLNSCYNIGKDDQPGLQPSCEACASGACQSQLSFR